MLIDTHSHIQFDDYTDETPAVLERARAAGVTKIIAASTDESNSAAAIDTAALYDNVWATIAIHPHEADRPQAALDRLAELSRQPKVVGIGECGLDYFRSQTTRQDQERTLRFQIELALDRDLPLCFHVRDAFPDFWRVLDSYTREGVHPRGLVHCFSSGLPELEGSLERGLLIALNGIMTFSKDPDQLTAARAVPLDRLVLETDCPWLAPVPHRGRRNEPAYTRHTAEFLADLRGETLDQLATATTANAEKFFGI